MLSRRASFYRRPGGLLPTALVAVSPSMLCPLRQAALLLGLAVQAESLCWRPGTAAQPLQFASVDRWLVDKDDGGACGRVCVAGSHMRQAAAPSRVVS